MESTMLIEAKTAGGLAPIKVLDFDTKGDNLSFFYEKINCECVDIVPAYGIAKEFPALQGICLVVDDEGLCKDEIVFNPIGSLLYGYLDHGQPLAGDVLVCKDVYTEDGIETGGLTDEEIDMVQAAIHKLVTKHNQRLEEQRKAKA